ncbi:glycosyltransferase family 39 protein [Marivirga sp. S37H4]|uniref:Glycosyltransferase family 39 protein n=1 Tax=Marivirga aurantiaca TaxID=2802615 RepID=A0A934X1K8_9BACT|nr:glycosyltransferase family 39 protein [Marivirga aurantiaca]MBK6266641.1 glycosyltransferase family 39 protein [Marivirga aurantiaca]
MQIKKLISKLEFNPAQKLPEINMLKPSSVSKRTELILLGACLLFATSILLYCSWGGLIWTSDSFQYWAASRSFQAEGIFLSHDGGSYIYWPPLFPMLLSLFSSENAYYFAHILLFNAALLCIYLFLKQISSSNKTALIVLFIFCISLFPYLMSTFLWTEIFFTLLLYGGLYTYAKWEKNHNNFSYLIWILVFSAMCLQRNAGIFIMAGISIYALTQFSRNKNYKKLLLNAGGVLIAVLPNLIWNLTIMSKASDPSSEIEINFFNGLFINISNILIRLFHFIFPAQLLGIVDFIAIISMVLILAILILKKSHSLVTILMMVYLTMYSFMPLIEADSIDRFLAPILPLFILLLVNLASSYSLMKGFLFRFGIVLLISLFVIYNAGRTYKNIKMWHERSIVNPKGAKIFF